MATTPGIKLVCTADGCGEKSVARRLCHKHYQAAWKSGQIGEHPKQGHPRAKLSGHVCPPDHRHDQSSTCYIQHQCRCTPCRHRNAAKERRRTRDIAYGRYDSGLVDADPVREHVLRLSEYGIGYKRVAQLSGVHTTTVRQLVWGREEPDRKGELPKRMKRENAERILAVRPTIENLGARQSVPATGTHRRVQALVTRGWSVSRIGRELEWEPANFHGMMQRDMVGAATHRAVADLYERLWDVEPPRTTHREKISYTRAVEYARRRRWLPPLAWDDIDTDPEPPVVDDDGGGLDEIAVELAIAGEAPRLTKEEQVEVVKRLHASRWGDVRIARTLHRDANVVKRIRDDLGLPAWTIAEQQEAAA